MWGTSCWHYTAVSLPTEDGRFWNVWVPWSGDTHSVTCPGIPNLPAIKGQLKGVDGIEWQVTLQSHPHPDEAWGGRPLQPCSGSSSVSQSWWRRWRVEAAEPCGPSGSPAWLLRSGRPHRDLRITPVGRAGRKCAGGPGRGRGTPGADRRLSFHSVSAFQPGEQTPGVGGVRLTSCPGVLSPR